MIKAKLTGIKVGQLHIISDALENYSNYLDQLITNFETSDQTKSFKSICWELQQEINKKATKDFPAINNSIKLPYHKLNVIVNAFLHYQSQLKMDSYERAILFKYTNTLIPQLR